MTCALCGKSAGFLRRQHKECAREVALLTGYAEDAAHDPEKLESLQSALDRASLTSSTRDAIVREGYGRGVDATLEDGVINDAEREALDAYRARFHVPDAERADALTRGTILNAVLEGRVDEINVTVTDMALPFNFQKSEKLIFACSANYAKTVVEREFRGGSLGASVRIAKGVYLRPSAFRGKPVSKSSLRTVDSGVAGVTTKHLYFAGQTEKFRVRYDKIVTFEPYDDALGFMRDNARAKPEAFTGVDGWFLYNLVTNLSQAL